MSDISKSIEKYALANAFAHEGKAQAGAVIGKLIAEDQNLKKVLKELAPQINNITSQVNKLTIKQQEEKLLQIYPEFFEKKEKEHEEKVLPELPNAKEGKVVTRFAPYPSGALHMGNLKPAIISYLYAKKYKGKFIIRIEDTNPEKMKPEYLKYIAEDVAAIGLTPDIPIYKVSAHFDHYIDLAKKLIHENKAYVCTCTAVGQKKGRVASVKTTCACRPLPVKTHEKRFADMIVGKYKEHAAILRFKTNIKDPNPALRDPTIYKVCDMPHAITGKKYHIYPMYNFQCAIEDHDYGITHAFRAVEHTANTEIQKKIFDAFGWKNFPNVVNFGFLYLIGTNIHKRHIREGFDSGLYKSWDDIVLGEKCGVVRALLRRGIQPHTFERLMIDLGVSPNVARISWDMIYAINRKLIDPIAHRYSFVPDAVKVEVKGAPAIKEIEVKLHPDKEGEMKKVKVGKTFYISKKDFSALKGKEVRLMHLYNICLNSKAEFTSKDNKEIPRITWVPADFSVAAEVIMPDGLVVKGFAEENCEKLKVGDIIQFERFGFVRLDTKAKGKLGFVFTHN